MPVAAELSYVRQAVAEQRLVQYEAYEYQRLLLDELTDQSERLAAPMVNSFDYRQGERGLETLQGDALRPILEKGLRVAVERAANRPEWHFEIARRQLELEELDMAQAMMVELAAGQGHNALVVLSPCPDAVLRQDNSIDGYDRHRKKLMVRIIEVSGDGARITSMSLDGSNYKAMQAVVQALGDELPTGLGSEEILARRFRLALDDEDRSLVAGAIREAYDRSLSDQLGGEWYAGRSPIDVQDALAFIRQQGDLLEAHMQAVREVQSTIHDAQQQEHQLEFHRFNLAAALDARLRGQQADDLEAAGRTARSEGREFSRECPTMAGAEEQLASLGYGEQLCTCPFCFKKVSIDPCANRITCPECHAEVRDGVVVNYGDTSRSKAQKAVGRHALAVAGIKKNAGALPHNPVRRPPDGTRVIVAGSMHILRREVVLGGREMQLVTTDGKVTLRGREVERLVASQGQ